MIVEVIKDYALFLAKTITISLAIFLVLRGVATILRHQRRASPRKIRIKKLNRHYENLRDAIKDEMLSEHEWKKAAKERHKRRKAEKKKAKSGTEPEKKKVFVLSFKGDILASAVSSLREEVTAVLTVAKPSDEVVVRLESAGGTVNSYGLAASQLLRLKRQNIPLTVLVDKVAASGGYLMACVADRILAAPFAVVGSIGVVSEVPNFNRLLKKHDIDYELITAGEYKRTLTLFGENTEKGRKKFIEQLEDVHAIFKAFLKENRAQVDTAAVATGEHWHGKRAIELKLVDELMTSDDYLFAASEKNDIYEVEYKIPETLRERLISGLTQALNQTLHSLWSRFEKQSFV
ncbi:MAG: protease SohB [bacterium]